MKTFFGGVHPKEKKELTETLQTQTIPLPDTVYIHLNQHLGKPAIPVVKVGDKVDEGDVIADADGFISAPIHASITGTVKKIIKHPHVLGLRYDAIMIERDKEAEEKKWMRNDKTIESLDATQFIQALKDKGVVGLGGAAFPTYVKFMIDEKKTLDTVLINACECEPYLTVDYRAMLEEADAFIEGLRLIKHTMNNVKIVIGIEDNKPKAIQLMREECAEIEGVSVRVVKTKYPQGGEKMLIKAILNKEVPSGGLPIDVGVVVTNVHTVIAMRNAVFYDQPILEKRITVSGEGIETPKNIKARIGQSFSEIVEFCGGVKPSADRLIVGGPMMGFALPNMDATVLKSTTGLLALTTKEIKEKDVIACLKCGQCVQHCPMGLIPIDIAKFIEFGKLDLALKAGLMDCIECGCCGYICTANRPLVQFIKLGKHRKQIRDRKERESS